MAQNQTSQAGEAAAVDPTIRMDSRKFLGAFNDSAQAKIAFIEGRITQMGQETGRHWRLAALRGTNMFIEEVGTGAYYQADYRREKGGKIVIENIRPIKIIETAHKSRLFLESCLDLVGAIENNDQRGMSLAYDKMAGQRFSSRAVPYSGKVRTRDGVIRSITVQTDKSLDEASKHKLLAAIIESLKDRITVRDGIVTEATFTDGSPLKLPVTKWSTYKLAARRMREVANEASNSPGFQARTYQLAQLIHEDKIEGAVQAAVPFLREFEEFTLLTRKQFQTLVENALAANGVFNQQLCDDTALLMYRTNLRVNRDTMLTEWRRIAKAAQHPTLLENVNILGKSKNFENATDKFLQLVFEAMSNRDVTAEALATTLEVLRDRTPKIKESHELASKLNDLISRLKDKGYDDNAIYEAEDFIATVQEELTTGEDLHNFDEMPGGTLPEEPEPGGAMMGDALGGGQPGQGQQGTPSVVFNAPLISIGGEMAEKLGLDGGGEEEGEDDDLSDLLGGEAEQAGGEQDAMMAGAGQAAAPPGGGAPGLGGAGGFPEGRTRGSALSEEWDEEKYGEAPWKKKKGKDGKGNKDKSKQEDPAESADPYRITGHIQPDARIGADYGAPPIQDDSDLMRVVNAMQQLAEQHQLRGVALQENLEDLALAGFEATGMRIPPRKLSHAVDQVVGMFSESLPAFLKDKDDEGDEGEDDHIEGLDEQQYKWGTYRKTWGKDKSDYAPVGKYRKNGRRGGGGGGSSTPAPESESDSDDSEPESSTPSESKIRWRKRQKDALLGEMAGVRFILDHNPEFGQPVILSEDGNVEIPIPDVLVDSAYAVAGLRDRISPIGRISQRHFIDWLREGLEQLRPESDEEADALDTGMDEPGPADELADAGAEMGAAEDDLADAGTDLAAAGDEMMGGPDDMMDPEDDMMGEPGLDDMDGEAGLLDDPSMMGAEDGLEGSTVTIKTSPDGTVQINVDAAHAEVIQGSPEDEMQPVDSIMAEPDAMGAGAEEMPDFEGDELGPDEIGAEDDLGPEGAGLEGGPEELDGDVAPGGAAAGGALAPAGPPAAGPPAAGPPARGPAKPPRKPAKPAAPDFVEDHDITSPKSSKYTKEIKANLRDQPEVKLPGKGGDTLKDFGKKPREAGKSGSDVTPVRKGGDD